MFSKHSIRMSVLVSVAIFGVCFANAADGIQRLVAVSTLKADAANEDALMDNSGDSKSVPTPPPPKPTTLKKTVKRNPLTTCATSVGLATEPASSMEKKSSGRNKTPLSSSIQKKDSDTEAAVISKI